jgi:hypothetical protein
MMAYMKVPASYLAASYNAIPPKINTLQVTMIGTEWVHGEFGSGLREVFGYFHPPNPKEPESTPYIAFVTCRSDRESILQFTREWGPLGGEELFGFEERLFSADQLRSRRHFCFTLHSWREIQQRFKRAIAAVSGYGKAEHRPPEIHLRMPYSLSTLTILAPRQQGLRPELRPNSLLSAFWLMFWKDASAEGVRVCRNEKCLKEFRVTRSDQAYCCPRCALVVAKRKWWRETGAAKRRKARKAHKRKGR